MKKAMTDLFNTGLYALLNIVSKKKLKLDRHYLAHLQSRITDCKAHLPIADIGGADAVA